MTFKEHKDITINDCQKVISLMQELVAQVGEGDFRAFEKFWLEGATEEGDSRIMALRQIIILRYLYREEQVDDENIPDLPDKSIDNV